MKLFKMRLFKLKTITKNLDFCNVTQTKQTNGSVSISVNINDVDETFLKPLPNYFNL